ncbi:DUF1415 domain-containing protein [Agaribacter marinus]|uniref:DUF1415 domain-containing protein n=1 Tax=Agaribacter marinus TaxID=1431249 RepID=A0AA37WLU0_9ALTE|nr:DUF1415 domain-containing protein [Agaribacter marinus]GLR73009.1 hypothetical protein GCM10007852_39170 [Agaribacter marinus]
MSAPTIEKKIYTWLDEVIIGQNFCPFAKNVRIKQRIKLTLSDNTSLTAAVSDVLKECDALTAHDSSQIDTTLLAFTKGFDDFQRYLDLLEEVNFVAKKAEFEGIYQFASFHPNYLFEGEPPDSPSHYTNRSPYPLIHILREDSLSRVLKHYPNPEGIPERNISHAEKLGISFFRQYLNEY